MSAGGPEDHPISDIIRWNLEVYGEIADAEFVELAGLMSEQELYAWWEAAIGWSADHDAAREAIHMQLVWARARAKASGWELAREPNVPPSPRAGKQT